LNQFDAIRSSKDSIEVCGNYQKIITDDVLMLSKLDLNKVDLNVEPMSIKALVSNVVSMFEGKASRKGLYIKKGAKGLAANTIVIGDYHRISQILTNLLSVSHII
jgi:signal transduction histidine kinase